MKCNIVGEGNTELLSYYLLLYKKSTFKRIVKSEEVICKNPELFRIKDFWVGTVRSRFVPTAPSRLRQNLRAADFTVPKRYRTFWTASTNNRRQQSATFKPTLLSHQNKNTAIGGVLFWWERVDSNHRS